MLLGEGTKVTFLDGATNPQISLRAARWQAAGVGVRLGEEALSAPLDYDLAVLSPGIEASVPMVARLAAAGIPVLGEVELAFSRCRCPVLAITGSNGKTTTTGLAEAMLQAAGCRATACGNIGRPFSDVVREEPDLEVAVVEVSSFQLESVDSFRPRVAVWTNFSPNHLDRYPDVAAYFQAKLRIFARQDTGDDAVVNAAAELPPLAARRTTFSAWQPADFTLQDGWIHHAGRPLLSQASTRLRGPHNAENLMAALAAGMCLGFTPEALVAGAERFRPQPHRFEAVAELEGVTWINDSKSTTLDSLEMAVRACEGRVILLAGGKDKGFGFEPLAGLIHQRVHAAVLIGELRHRIAAAWADGPAECHQCASLEEAVELCRQLARRGDTVLFSPGTSSYDMFRSYAHRGDTFKSLVQKNNQTETTTP